jgi:hypothetical protein
MGESQHPLGPKLGRLLFIWGQGTEYGNMLRGWIGPISLATGVAKYMGLSTEASVALGIGIPVGITALTLAAGYYHVRVGGARHTAQQSNDNDPWRVETLRILRTLERRLEER